ncbi:MAG: hypothetical protein K8R37_11960 [Bacteroidales bacterium]|nr:hypothetical protein [Bacteroidales bacterium]
MIIYSRGFIKQKKEERINLKATIYVFMLIITDNRIPEQAKESLSRYGEVVRFETKGITYQAISGHPDIFFCRAGSQLIIAPNLPEHYKKVLTQNSISFVEGELPTGYKYPESAKYNVATTDKYLIHNFRFTDPVITDQAADLDFIHVNQGYCRCNLFPLKDDHFITSDKGIYRVLSNYNFNVLMVDPKGIVLPGFEHGFFGGACGVFKDNVFVLGNLHYFDDGEKVRQFLKRLDYEIVELYNGPLFDGGTIMFI